MGDEAYSVDKCDDRLTVTFRSSVDFQKGLETVIVQLAAQERVKPGILYAFELREADASVEIKGVALRRLLGGLAEALRSGTADTQRLARRREADDPHALSAGQESLHEAVESLPPQFAARLVARILEERSVRRRDGSMSDVYGRSIVGLRYVNRRMLPEAGSESPPGDADFDA